MTTAARLWEAEHPYYGPEASGSYTVEYDSWLEFADEWGRNDQDLNLVFRWDWVDGTGDDEEDPADLPCGEEGPNGIPIGSAELTLFAVMPRKSTLVNVVIKLTRADEPLARVWLLDRWRHLMRLWHPLAPDIERGAPAEAVIERSCLFYAEMSKEPTS
jgi:hypothetical protein